MNEVREKIDEMKSMSKMMCSRELTLTEELKELNIEGKDKERIIKKACELEKQLMQNDEYLHNCHIEMDQLKNAVIEQAKIIGMLKREIKNMRIECRF